MNKILNLVSPEAVQSHLGITQSVIQRMAANSTASKAWCITLVSAILVIVAEREEPNYAFIGVVPTLLFFILDTYYLALEKAFRQSYNEFIDKLHNGKVISKDLYVITPKGSLAKGFIRAICSVSIWPFYITMLIVIWIFRSAIF